MLPTNFSNSPPLSKILTCPNTAKYAENLFTLTSCHRLKLNVKLSVLVIPLQTSIFKIAIQDGPKVRRQTATTHGGGVGESFEVGNPCPETHRYAPVSTFLERMNVRLATSYSSGQRASSGMRFSFVSFHVPTCSEPV